MMPPGSPKLRTVGCAYAIMDLPVRMQRVIVQNPFADHLPGIVFVPTSGGPRMETPAHPGTIVYAKIVDGQEIVVSERPVAEVPETLRFCATPQGPVPVVKAVALM